MDLNTAEMIDYYHCISMLGDMSLDISDNVDMVAYGSNVNFAEDSPTAQIKFILTEALVIDQEEEVSPWTHILEPLGLEKYLLDFEKFDVDIIALGDILEIEMSVEDRKVVWNKIKEIKKQNKQNMISNRRYN